MKNDLKGWRSCLLEEFLSVSIAESKSFRKKLPTNTRGILWYSQEKNH